MASAPVNSAARKSPVERSRSARPRGFPIGVQGGQKVVALGAVGRVDRGAGREDAGDFAANDLFGELGVLHLLADGDAVALAEQTADVAFGRVIGDAAHRDRALAIAGGEGDLQLAGGGFRVVEKEFVKIAHAEEEQGVRILRFCCHVLAHERGKRGGGSGLGGVDGFAGRSWKGFRHGKCQHTANGMPACSPGGSWWVLRL